MARGRSLFVLVAIAHFWALVTATDLQNDYSRRPENYGEGARDDLVDWSAHPCRRECRDDKPAMTCRYGMTIEEYQSMSHACFKCPLVPEDCFRPHCVLGDGTARVVYTANRKIASFAIEVCKGDRLLIDVTNSMEAETTTIHWHGMHQRGSPFMDGVPYITQCPILPGESFRYDFMADIAGTFIWHSHSGFQRSDGLFGPLIIRSPPSQNKALNLYDRDEHYAIMNEWYNISRSKFRKDLYYNNIFTNPHGILVNGMGRRYGTDEEAKNMPLTIFHVKKGYRYRFRFIHIGLHNCPFYISIDNHTMHLISTDGADVKPVELRSIRMTTGERYDVVVSADRKVANYFIRFVGDNNCEFTTLYQNVILRYKGAAESEPLDAGGYDFEFYRTHTSKQLNPFDEGSEIRGAITTASLKSLEENDASLTHEPDYKFYLRYSADVINDNTYYRKPMYGFNELSEGIPREIQRINKINFKRPRHPLVTQPELIRPGDFCNETTVTADCDVDACQCTHVLQVKLGSVVELITVDDGSIVNRLNHPFHLHGYYFRVLAMQKVNTTLTIEDVKALEREGKVRRNLKAAPLRDTIALPRGGYAILRFNANNPGYWFFHCHYDMHLESGMGLIFKVGEHEQFPKVPNEFPKC